MMSFYSWLELGSVEVRVLIEYTIDTPDSRICRSDIVVTDVAVEDHGAWIARPELCTHPDVLDLCLDDLEGEVDPPWLLITVGSYRTSAPCECAGEDDLVLVLADAA